MVTNMKISPFGLERKHCNQGSLRGIEQANIYINNKQHQPVQPVQHHSANNDTMILPVLKISSSTNLRGQDSLRTQVTDSTPPAATHLDIGNAMDDIMSIHGNHDYIDDMAGTSTPVQLESQPGEVSIFENKTKILTIISPSSQKLLRTILEDMKLPVMMKKYLDAYTLYIGQNTLQIFANFEDDPPITSSRISSTSLKVSSDDEEESDTDSGVGRFSPTQHDEDDEFTVLWYGTDDSGDLSDISEVEGIFPDTRTEDDDEEDPDDIIEKEVGGEYPHFATNSEEEGIFPDLPIRTYQEADRDNIVEEEDEEDEILSELRITSCRSVTSSVKLSVTSPTGTPGFIKTEEYVDDILTHQDDDDDDISRVTIANIRSLGEELGPTSISSSPLDLESLCHALSNITINQHSSSGEYVEDENDTKDKKFEEKPTTTGVIFPPPVRPDDSIKEHTDDKDNTENKNTEKEAISATDVFPPRTKPETQNDPLSISKPEKKDIEISQEQAHNILTPYYRTVEEPWDQQTANDPRVTLAAMFKANSNKFRQDSAARQCSRLDCQYRTDCYWEREWEQRQGRGLYHYTQCI